MSGGARVIDARGLPAPRPFELVMEALCELGPDEDLLVILNREPTPLYQALRRSGYTWQTTRFDDDGRYEVRITQLP